MPDARLERARRSLPEGYQFPTPTEHCIHLFNTTSGYCECGLQYAPHLAPWFHNGGALPVNPPTRFITRLPSGLDWQ